MGRYAGDRARRPELLEAPQPARGPELRFLGKLEPGTVLDGEVVVLRKGKPDFGLLLSRLGTRQALRARIFSQSTRATYVVFDQLYERYSSLMECPLYDRRTRQRLASRYSPGARSDAWLKIKRREMMVCVVLGYVPSERGGFRSLILASELGGELRSAGRLTRGFDKDARARIEVLLRARPTQRAFVPTSIRGRWVEPGIYLTVRYTELSARGNLRFPVFERLCEG